MLLYILLIFILLLTVILLLHLRIRVVWGDGNKLLFVGLGKTGPEFNFNSKKARLCLFNVKIKEFSLEKKPKEKKKPEKKKVKDKPKKQRSYKDMLRMFPKVSKELFSYIKNILASLIVEELEADIEAGFESPDLTGQAYGYYQAALAAVPGVMNHINYSPNWTRPTLSVKTRASVSLPLYKLVWRTIVLLWRLPLRELYKLAIGTNIRRT